jgi:CheY-like chemotaxis protein
MSRILIVDDDPSFRTMLSQMLERAGYEVQEAENGNAALAAYSRQSSDLIITDLVMPEKEGIETIMEFRRTNPQAKIIAISGGGRINPEVTLDLARKLGANRCLAKPFTQREILDAVAQLLGAGPK